MPTTILKNRKHRTGGPLARSERFRLRPDSVGRTGAHGP